jgi:peroxiredoxin
LDNVQALYQAYKAGRVKKEDYTYYINAWGGDTLHCTSDYVKTFVAIATGKSKNGQKYYLFDSNNNFNMADEVPYKTVENKQTSFVNYNSEFQPHKIIYEKFIDNKIQQDSTWIAFFEFNKMMCLQFCEHTTTSFQFDSINYQLNTFPSNGYLAKYENNTFFKFSKNMNENSQILNIGEYIKLNNSYYRINCSRDGLKITLTKDVDALKEGSTQIGMSPISYKAKSFNGESINFPADYKGKYVLLDFWATSCGPCVQEIKNYYIDMYKKYGGNQFEIIGVADNLPNELEDFIKSNHINWTIIPDGESKFVQKKYKIYQYPTLYLINPQGVIISKGDELRSGKFESILEKNIKTK